MKLRIALLAFILVSVWAFAQGLQTTPTTEVILAPVQTYTLKNKFIPGEIRWVKSIMLSNDMIEYSGMPGMEKPIVRNGDSVSLMKIKTLGVDANGNATILASIESTSIKVNGVDVTSTIVGNEKKTSKMVIDPSGKMVGTPVLTGLPKMPGIDSDMMMNGTDLPGVTGVIIPATPVKVGDTWDTEIDMPDSIQMLLGKDKAGLKVKLRFTFVGVEVFKGTPAYRIKSAFFIPLNNKIEADPAENMPAMDMTGSIESNMTTLYKANNLEPMNVDGSIKTYMVITTLDNSPGKLNSTMKMVSTMNLSVQRASPPPSKPKATVKKAK